MKWLKLGLAGLLGLLLLAVAVLWVMGRRADAGRNVAEVVIAQPPEAVWEWLMEPARFRQWVSWVTDVREEGGRRVITMTDPNANGEPVVMYSTLVREEKPRHLEVSITAPMGFRGNMTYTLASVGEGRTKLNIDARFQYDHWFAALLEPLVTPQAQAKLDADLLTLQRLAQKR